MTALSPHARWEASAAAPRSPLRRAAARPLCLLALLLASVLLSASFGPTGFRLPWPLSDAVVALRAPRAVLATLVGAGLAVSGCAMQVLLHNPLAEPYVLGLSGGASLSAVASLWALPQLPPGPAAALGAALAALFVRRLAGSAAATERILLAGVAVGSILASGTGLLITLAPSDQLLRSSTYWLFGGLGTPRWSAPISVAALLGPALLAMWWRAERLDRLALGAEVAATLGVDVVPTRRWLFAVSVLLTGASVACAGLVGFVGLMAPHIGRRLVGGGHRALLPCAAVLGGFIVVVGDVLARTVLAPRELPVGLITAALGGPFFLWQIRRRAGEAT